MRLTFRELLSCWVGGLLLGWLLLPVVLAVVAVVAYVAFMVLVDGLR